MSLQEELGLRTPFGDLRHETVQNVVRTGTMLSSVANQVFRDHGLTEAQFNVLFALAFSEGDITQATLSKRLMVTRASITSVLDKLEAKSLVRRANVASNRRIHYVRLTEEGRKLVAEVEPAYREEVDRALGGLSDTECRQLIGLLERARIQTKARLGACRGNDSASSNGAA